VLEKPVHTLIMRLSFKSQKSNAYSNGLYLHPGKKQQQQQKKKQEQIKSKLRT